MSVLYKPLIYEFIPGTPGTPGDPGSTSTTSFGDGSGTPADFGNAETEITLFIPQTTTVYYPGYGYSPSGVGPSGVIEYEAVTVTVPASGGGGLMSSSSTSSTTSGTPSPPPTPAQINTYFDREWNSAADSIGEIAAGNYIEFKVQLDSHAVFVGLDAVSKNSTLPSAYRYGIMVDGSGARIFENGVTGALLTANTPDTVLRIHRGTSGKVYYQVVGGSLVPSPQDPIAPTATIHGYGLLYSSLDAVTDAAITATDIAEVSVPIPIEMGLSVMAQPRVEFDIQMDLAVGTAPAAIMPITMGLELSPSSVKAVDVTFPMAFALDVSPTGYGSGTWNLPMFQILGAEEGYDAPGSGTWVLPRFSMTGTEQTFVPAVVDEGFWILPRWAMLGQGLSEDWGDGDWSLPAFAMLGAEEGVEYGQGEWELILRFGMISNPPWWPEDTMMMVSGLFESQTISMQTELVLILDSNGVLTSTLSLTRVQLLSLLSSLASSTSVDLSGIYNLTLLGNMSVSSLQALRTLTGADLPSNAAVWVVNMDTAASAQYDDYGFNSFFRRGNDYYGVANDGIYKLSGATDAGSPIDAFAAFVKSTFGMQSVKHIPTVYIGSASDGGLVLRVDVDGVARHYKARTASGVVANHRVDVGRGVKGVYWEFELMNQNGDDFDIADITMIPIVRDRRV